MRETVNKFEGTCIRCDCVVPAGEGFMRTVSNKDPRSAAYRYLPIHQNCAEAEKQERRDRKSDQTKLF